MDEWTLPGWVIPFAWILVGWTIGFIDSNRRTARKIKQAEEKADSAIQDAESKVAQIKARLAEIPTTPVAIDDPGLFRVKDENGTLTLDLDGMSVNPTALAPEQRKRMIEILTNIRPWLEGKPAIAPTPAPTSPPPARPATVAPAPLASLAPQPSPVQAPTSKTKSSKKKGEEVEPPPTSIVGQINLVLQQQIINTPLASRGVSLMESATGGVNVYVGIDRYEGVDDVPDEEIKTAIRAAIAEWERKYTPGLS